MKEEALKPEPVTAFLCLFLWLHPFLMPSLILAATGRGDPPAHERRALPRVFGKAPGERGGRFQGGDEESPGLQPKTKELQEEEEMCCFVKIKGQRTPLSWQGRDAGDPLFPPHRAAGHQDTKHAWCPTYMWEPPIQKMLWVLLRHQLIFLHG